MVTADFSQEKTLRAQENMRKMQPIMEDSVKIVTNQGSQVTNQSIINGAAQNQPLNMYSVYSLLNNMDSDQENVKSGLVKLKDGSNV